jgi:hypothetical protein
MAQGTVGNVTKPQTVREAIATKKNRLAKVEVLITYRDQFSDSRRRGLYARRDALKKEIADLEAIVIPEGVGVKIYPTQTEMPVFDIPPAGRAKLISTLYTILDREELYDEAGVLKTDIDIPEYPHIIPDLSDTGAAALIADALIDAGYIIKEQTS